MLSRLVITFLPRSKRLLISWLQSPSAVILEPPKIKSLTVSIVCPSICHEVMGPEPSRSMGGPGSPSGPRARPGACCSGVGGVRGGGPMSIESVMPSNHLILCCPLFLLPSTFPSIRVFSNELALHIRWPKYWSFSFNISPSGGHPGLISFRMDWLDLLAVQGTLKSLLQHHSSKASILRCLAFFIVQI